MKKYFFVFSLMLLFSGGCSFFKPTIFVYHFYLDYNENGTATKEEFNNKVLTILQEYAKEMNLEYLGIRKYSETGNSHVFENNKKLIPVFFNLQKHRIKIVGGESKSEYLLNLLKKLRGKLTENSIHYMEEEQEIEISFLTPSRG